MVAGYYEPNGNEIYPPGTDAYGEYCYGVQDMCMPCTFHGKWSFFIYLFHLLRNVVQCVGIWVGCLQTTRGTQNGGWVNVWALLAVNLCFGINYFNLLT